MLFEGYSARRKSRLQELAAIKLTMVLHQIHQVITYTSQENRNIQARKDLCVSPTPKQSRFSTLWLKKALRNVAE